MAWHVRVLPALFVSVACSASITDDRAAPLGATVPSSGARGTVSPGMAGASSGTAGAPPGTAGALSSAGGVPPFSPSQLGGTPSGGSHIDDRPGNAFRPGFGGGDAGATVPPAPTGVSTHPDASA